MSRQELWILGGGAVALWLLVRQSPRDGDESDPGVPRRGHSMVPKWPARVDPGGFVWPVPALFEDDTVRRPVVTSGYGPRDPARPGGGSFHWGVDILYPRLPHEPSSGPHGTKRYAMPARIPALAVADGVVSVAKRFKGGGGVRIDHGNGIRTDYLHLRPHLVASRERVKRGQVVGLIGYDTRKKIDLYHLHFNLWLGNRKVDPEPYLAKWDVVTFDPKARSYVS